MKEMKLFEHADENVKDVINASKKQYGVETSNK